MKRLMLILTVLCWLVVPGRAHAQDAVSTIEVPSALQDVWAGMYHFIEPSTGDTLAMLVFNPITIYPRERFRNKKEEEFYWKTVRDVKKTLPYAKLISKMLVDIDRDMAALPNDKARKKYMEDKEDELLETYKPILKKFTLSQGKMLIRLVDRQCDKTSYQLIKQFRGGFRAVFWQGFAKMFGANLKTTYDPNNEDDRIVERVITLVEAGQL